MFTDFFSDMKTTTVAAREHVDDEYDEELEGEDEEEEKVINYDELYRKSEMLF